MKWTKQKRQALSKAVKRGLSQMPREEQARLDEVRRAQAAHGVEGGKPPVFPSCTHHQPYTTSNGKIKVRHRWEDGICRCGVVNAPAMYRWEEQADGSLVWYVRDGKDWKPFAAK